ncbi:MAG: DUF4956 domain-containing protein [Cetobacterium sp.]|nr:DUF4956 domain-containing protein [Cetobacterium sp.]
MLKELLDYLKLPFIFYIIKSLIMTFILILIISTTYKKIYKNDDYKLKFNILISIFILITTMIMSIIKININTSLGLLGILSLIRFRVKLKDFRDVGFILWGIGAGITIGTEHYLIGFVYSLVISLYFIVTNKKFSKKDLTNLLIIRTNNLDKTKLENLLLKECETFNNIATEKKQTYTEYIYNIHCKKQFKLKEKLNSKFELDFFEFI